MITTGKGFKKPQDSDNADLRVFVGDNMDLLDTELDKYFLKTGGDLSGDVTIRKTNAGLNLVDSTADEWFKLYHTANAFYVQSRLADGTWKANPFSIEFATGKTNINNGLGVSGGATLSGGSIFNDGVQINSTGKTIGGGTLANGWLRVGSTLAMDDNEIYFGGAGYLGTIGNYDMTIKANGKSSYFRANGDFEPYGDMKMQKSLYLHSGWGNNHFSNGTGDGATRTTHNIKMRGWWGLGMYDHADEIHGVYDFRAGKWDVDYGYDINGTTLLRGGDEGNLVVYSKHGYVAIAPQNTGYCHYSTDRSNHWFNKDVKVNGEIYAGSGYSKRVFHEGYTTGLAKEQKIGSKTLNAGWYTIGHIASGRASAKFVICDKRSGTHQTVHFYASHNYGNGEHITVLNNGQYGGGGAFRYLRMMGKSTYDGAYLQVYIDIDGTVVDGSILENIQTDGWTPIDWTRADTITGYTEQCKVDLDLGGLNATTINTTGNVIGTGLGFRADNGVHYMIKKDTDGLYLQEI